MQKIDPGKMSLHERVEKLNDMICKGYILEAFEKFYADDIIRKDNNNITVAGKSACRSKEESLVTGITAFRKARVKNVIIGSQVSVVEWEFEYVHEEWGECKYSQIAVQQWNCDGQIFSETNFNNN
jgi:hypothetical protein